LLFSNTNKDITRTMTLTNEVKERLEEVINDWLLRFNEIAESESHFLEAVGLEPKLETLLSYTIGVLDSIVGGYIHCLYNRGMTEDEDVELIELLQGKMPELELKFKLFLNEE
jgi:hypothetical protein